MPLNLTRLWRAGDPPGVVRARGGPIGAKRLVFALVPTLLVLVLVGGVEGALRLAGVDAPILRKPPLPAELAGIHQADDELFWTLRPNYNGGFEGIRVVSNSQSLRGPEIGAKTPGEFRILSLGESTTFGAMVDGEQTYSARLESFLNAAGAPARFVVFNAGVCAYTSFQSLTYLELRGLALRPDLVLFYHEYNDYLPSTVRDFGSDEHALALTDRQLHASQAQWFHRKFQAWSAIYRWLSYRAARRRLDEMQTAKDARGSMTGGVVMRADAARNLKLPVRVPPEDRKRTLEELRDLCRRSGVRLVVIHPTYKDSRPHTCILTEFCTQSGVPMFEAFGSLHPGGPRDYSLFHDIVHPTAEGHERLARDLAGFLIANGLVPRASSSRE